MSTVLVFYEPWRASYIQLEGVTWEDVEPAVMMVLTPPPSPAGERQQAEANAGTPGRRDHVPPAGGSIRSGNSGEKPGGSGGGGHRGSGAGREPSLDGMTQQSLGMDYDGDLGGGEEDFQTQAPSAGNVFSQEEMDMRPASPTPSSPPSPGMASGGGGDGGGGGGSSSSSNPGGAAEAGAAAAPAAAPAPAQERNDGVAQESLPGSQGAVPNAHDDVPVGKEAREGQVGGAQPARRGGSANGKGPAARGGGGGRQPPGSSRAEEQDEEEEEEEEESGTDPIPPGFTQLDVLHTGDGELGLSEPQPQRRGAAGSENGEPEDDDDDEDENEQIGGRRRENGAAAGSARAGRTVTAAGKGKGRVSFQRPSPPEDGEEEDGIRAASAGGSGSGGGCGAATQDSLSQDDIFSPQELSGGTSSSSNIGTPNSNQLVLSCLTQKRQNEGLCHPNSGARNAAEKCDIRSVFRAGGGGGGAGAAAAPAIRRKHGGHNERDGVPRDGIIGNNGGGGAGSSSGYDGALSAGDGGISTASTPDTIEMPVEDGLPKSSVADRVARKFPMRPLRGGSVAGGRKRSRPLSDILVAVDPAWDGQGRAPIIARGPNADKGLAEWLDSSRPEKRPAPLSIAAWLDKYAGSGGGEHGGGSSGGAGRTTCGSSRRSGDGGGGSSAGGGGSSAGGGWRR